jgi:hypothetical protein
MPILITSEWRARLQPEAAAKLSNPWPEVERLRLLEATEEGTQFPLVSTFR